MCTTYFILHTAYCTMRTKHCTLHTTHYTLKTAHYTLHTAHCTLHTAHCTLHTSVFTLYILHWTVVTICLASGTKARVWYKILQLPHQQSDWKIRQALLRLGRRYPNLILLLQGFSILTMSNFFGHFLPFSLNLIFALSQCDKEIIG